jgi:hypothetical protein
MRPRNSVARHRPRRRRRRRECSRKPGKLSRACLSTLSLARTGDLLAELFNDC